jgi:hypothetical protein
LLQTQQFVVLISHLTGERFMSATLHLVNQSAAQPAGSEPVEKSPAKVAAFEPASDPKVRGSQEYLARLENEVRILREELARAQRGIEQRDILLKNSLKREQELRAELLKGIF